jgi:hypothetical protein
MGLMVLLNVHFVHTLKYIDHPNANEITMWQIMRELSKAVLEEDKIMIIKIMVLNLMQQNGC